MYYIHRWCYAFLNKICIAKILHFLSPNAISSLIKIEGNCNIDFNRLSSNLKKNLTLDLDSPYSFTYVGISWYLRWYIVYLLDPESFGCSKNHFCIEFTLIDCSAMSLQRCAPHQWQWLPPKHRLPSRFALLQP